MTKTVWITRTQPAANVSAEVWRAAGFVPLVLPLLSVETVAHEALPERTALIFTSKNGVDHALFRPSNLVICVGDATAAQARAAGYRNVVSVDGTSADVTAYVRANLPLSQRVTHISGWHVRGSITEDLRKAGYDAARVIVYRSRPVTTWPEACFDLIALYSPLAAQTFAKEAKDRDTDPLTTISISPATDAALHTLNLDNRYIAARPTEGALVSAALKH